MKLPVEKLARKNKHDPTIENLEHLRERFLFGLPVSFHQKLLKEYLKTKDSSMLEPGQKRWIKKESSPRRRTPPPVQHVKLGEGSYGIVYGPRNSPLEKFLSEHGPRGISKNKMLVEKKFKDKTDYQQAVRLQQVVNKIDPKRECLRGSMVKKDDVHHILTMNHEGRSLLNLLQQGKKEEFLVPLFEAFYQLLNALVLLETHKYVHKDIKLANITVNTKSGFTARPLANKPITLGLIDFDFLKESEDLDNTFSSAIYFVYPLETFYDIQTDRLGSFDDETMEHHEEPIGPQYFENLSFVKGVGKGQVRDMFRNLHIGRDYSPSSSRFLSPVLSVYLQLGRSDVRQKELKKDWKKVDPFGLGLVAYALFHGKENHDLLFEGHPHKTPLSLQLEDFLFHMVHPFPKERYDAHQAMSAWRELLSLYDPALSRRVARELDDPVVKIISPKRRKRSLS